MTEPKAYKRPCPYCGKEFGYYEAIVKPYYDGDRQYCPFCNKHIVWAMQVYPTMSEPGRWTKPS